MTSCLHWGSFVKYRSFVKYLWSLPLPRGFCWLRNSAQDKGREERRGTSLLVNSFTEYLGPLTEKRCSVWDKLIVWGSQVNPGPTESKRCQVTYYASVPSHKAHEFNIPVSLVLSVSTSSKHWPQQEERTKASAVCFLPCTHPQLPPHSPLKSLTEIRLPLGGFLSDLQ